jgi:hypothetical protein
MFENLCDDNFLLYAMRAYEKPNAIMSEFEEDFKRLKYVKRLIRRYKATSELKDRLILNHIIILANVFGVEAAVRMLFYRIDEKDYPTLKTFLLFLNYVPAQVLGIRGIDYNTSEISVDLMVGKRLREL